MENITQTTLALEGGCNACHAEHPDYYYCMICLAMICENCKVQKDGKDIGCKLCIPASMWADAPRTTVIDDLISVALRNSAMCEAEIKQLQEEKNVCGELFLRQVALDNFLRWKQEADDAISKAQSGQAAFIKKASICHGPLLKLAEMFGDACSTRISLLNDDLKEDCGDRDDILDMIGHWTALKKDCDTIIAQAHEQAS